MNWALISTIVAVFMATTMIFIRAKAAKKPATEKRIILPPLFMSTGALMFLFPTFQISFYQVTRHTFFIFLQTEALLKFRQLLQKSSVRL